MVAEIDLIAELHDGLNTRWQPATQMSEGCVEVSLPGEQLCFASTRRRWRRRIGKCSDDVCIAVCWKFIYFVTFSSGRKRHSRPKRIVSSNVSSWMSSSSSYV